MSPRLAPRLFRVLTALGGLLVPAAAAQTAYVNWESPHVAPLALSADGNQLYAVNTPDNRLEVFDLSGGEPRPLASIPVGLEPVSVRPFSSSVVWIVNHISDSISVVNLATLNVSDTIDVGDDPADVVFAGSPRRAFVTGTRENVVRVFDPADLHAAPIVLPIAGERPRALAVSTDGLRVAAAIFESGNRTTVLDHNTVSDPSGPYGGVNPPPNSGAAFYPPLTPGLPVAPAVALIVRKNTQNQWLDDNNHNWSGFVTWDLHDHDLAIIDANSLGVSYISGLMNINMALAPRLDGRWLVVGTDATNQVRFEPNVTAKFVHTMLAVVDPNSASSSILDLNPHLASAYQQGLSSVPLVQRELSLADPRAVAVRQDGSTMYVAGMGSNNVAAFDGNGQRLNQVVVGRGPTGLALDEARARLYVLNRFDATISVVSIASFMELMRVALPNDPTPPAVNAGKDFLYNATLTSGLGVTACAACHVDARTDELAWDLGNPAGQMKTFDQTCLGALGGGECSDWHPMKGPMTTQTLQGIVGTEPLHWRGDRENLNAFNGAFQTLLGGDAELTSAQLANMQAFIASIQYPPNPNRDLKGALSTNVAGGDAVQGEVLYRTGLLDSNSISCERCHALPAGTDQEILPANLPNRTAPQVMKVPQLRAALYKDGFDKTSLSGNRGFGFIHDGSTDTLLNFLSGPEFTFPTGQAGLQEKRDVIAFLLSFSTDTHAAVGVQVTQTGANNNDPNVAGLIDALLSLAGSDAIGLVVKGRVGGLERGYVYLGHGQFQSDRANEQVPAATLRTLATPGGELTWTAVQKGTEVRVGIDRNANGVYDGDEPPSCAGDLNHDHRVDLSDLALLLGNFACASGTCAGDTNHDGRVDLSDLAQVLSEYGSDCP